MRFDLMLGFFSSSAIRTLSDGFALFLFSGGMMRLIINNIFSSQDKDTIIAGTTADDRHSSASHNPLFDLSDIATLKNTLSEKDKHFFECLSWLIANKRIDIKIIAVKNEQGIAHMKEGVFYDGQNFVGFNGSCNFTQTALIGNRESIFISCDWDSETDKNRVKYSIEEFERTFSGKDDTVNYVEPSEIITNIEKHFGNNSIDELLEQEERLFYNEQKNIRSSIKKAMEKAREQVKKAIEIAGVSAALNDRSENAKP
jgi:HKD family nuclease